MIKQDLAEIIKQEDIGRYLGKSIDKGEEKDEYSAHVKMCLTHKGEYSVIVSPNFPHYFPVKLKVISYLGFDKNEAEKIFNEIVKKDKELKQSFIHKIFSKS